MKFSVIVPVYNYWSKIAPLIDALSAQTFSHADFEVILVDNGSTDWPVADLADGFQLTQCLQPGSYAARNHGVGLATGDWLVFTDADCRPNADWLEALDRAIDSQQGDGIIAGDVQVVAGDMEPNIYEMFDMVKGIPQRRYVSGGYAATANLAVPRTVFDAVGGFDPKRFSGGDAAFCRKAGQMGFPIRFAPDVVVLHPARDSWTALATKARRVKAGQRMKDTPARYRAWWRTVLPPAIAMTRFIRDTRHPVRYRLAAIYVLIGLWGVENWELLRLQFGKVPERR